MSEPGIDYPYMGLGNALPFCVRNADPDTSTFPPLYEFDSGEGWDYVPFPGSSAADQWQNFHWWFWRFKGVDLDTFKIVYESDYADPYDGPFEMLPSLPTGFENFHLWNDNSVVMDDSLYGPEGQRPVPFELLESPENLTGAYPVLFLELNSGDFTPDPTIGGLGLYLSFAQIESGGEKHPVLLYRLGDEDGQALTVGTPSNLTDPGTKQSPVFGVEIKLGPAVSDTATLNFAGCGDDQDPQGQWIISDAVITFEFWS